MTETDKTTSDQYVTLFEKNADLIVIFDADTHYFLDCNRVMEEKYGFSKEEIRYMKPEFLHPLEELDRVAENIDDDTNHDSHIYTHVTRSGKALIVETKTEAITFEGRSAWLTTVRDITDRKRTEQALEKQHRLWQSLLKISEASRETGLQDLYRIIHQEIGRFMPAMNFYIALVDDHERCRYYFPYYCDLRNEDDLYQGCTDTLPDSFTDWVVKNGPLLLNYQTVEKIISGQISVKVNISQIGKRASSWMGVPLTGRNNSTLGVMVVQDYTDPDAYDESDLNLLKIASQTVGSAIEHAQAEKEKISALKHAAEQEKQALVGQVAGKMAHDFNNILGVILGNSELALIDCTEPDMRRTLEIILNQAERGRILTRNLVAFARDQEPRQEFFDINEKIDLAVSLLKKDLENIRIIYNFAPGPPKLLADPGMIEHALINLIQNAIHAVSKTENPRIELRTCFRAGNIYIEIEDNGCGIPQEHRENIYIPSFTLKGSKDTSQAYHPLIKGTGYGMSNVKMYIEKHHGDICFTTGVNTGTTFVIRLPVTREKLTLQEIAEIEKREVRTNKRILLVEDEPAISDIQIKILTHHPFHHSVDLAPNGKTALELLKNRTYDIISLDYMLPGALNGMDIYHRIRQTDTRTPILFISGNIEFLESLKKLQEKDPLTVHLSKPCNNKTYADAVNSLLLDLTDGQGR